MSLWNCWPILYYAWIPRGFPGLWLWNRQSHLRGLVVSQEGVNFLQWLTMSQGGVSWHQLPSSSPRLSYSRGHRSTPPPEPTLYLFFCIFQRDIWPKVACGPWKLWVVAWHLRNLSVVLCGKVWKGLVLSGKQNSWWLIWQCNPTYSLSFNKCRKLKVKSIKSLRYLDLSLKINLLLLV